LLFPASPCIVILLLCILHRSASFFVVFPSALFRSTAVHRSALALAVVDIVVRRSTSLVCAALFCIARLPLLALVLCLTLHHSVPVILIFNCLRCSVLLVCAIPLLCYAALHRYASLCIALLRSYALLFCSAVLLALHRSHCSVVHWSALLCVIRLRCSAMLLCISLVSLCIALHCSSVLFCCSALPRSASLISLCCPLYCPVSRYVFCVFLLCGSLLLSIARLFLLSASFCIVL
jgi:hypothetical protein